MRRPLAALELAFLLPLGSLSGWPQVSAAVGGPPAEGALAESGEQPPKWVPEARLFADDQLWFWDFGKDVALDGDSAIVGAPGAQIEGDPGQGAAYVFVWEGGTWVEQARLVASDGVGGDPLGDDFGSSVALDGDTAVVGARLADVAGELGQGALYVFERSGSRWSEVQKLVASDGDALDKLGSSLALDGDTLVAGAVSEEGAVETAVEGCLGSGAAYVFVNQGGVWVEQAKLFDAAGECSDLFGNDVARHGDTALLGAYSASIAGDPSRGAAYVYTRAAGSWSLEQKLLASDGAEPDQFAWSVALDRDTALIGAPQKIIDGNPRQGAAYVFRRNGMSWTEEQRLTASDGHAEASFGSGAAIMGPLALVGAEFNFPGDPERGVVYEFRHHNGAWVEIQKFAAPEGNGFDGFWPLDLAHQRACPHLEQR